MVQFAVAAVSDRRKVLINKIRRSETAATAVKTYHYRIIASIVIVEGIREVVVVSRKLKCYPWGIVAQS